MRSITSGLLEPYVDEQEEHGEEQGVDNHNDDHIYMTDLGPI